MFICGWPAFTFCDHLDMFIRWLGVCVSVLHSQVVLCTAYGRCHCPCRPRIRSDVGGNVRRKLARSGRVLVALGAGQAAVFFPKGLGGVFA